MKYRYKSHNNREGIGQPGIRETCTNRSVDIHACLNCSFYDAHKPNQCKIDNIDLIKTKQTFVMSFSLLINLCPKE